MSPSRCCNGEWNNGDSCVNTTPLSRGSKVEHNRSSDPVLESVVEDTRVWKLGMTTHSHLRDDAHRSPCIIKGTSDGSDFLHWCLTGIPNTWNMILLVQM